MAYSPKPLSSAGDARDTAFAFAALYSHVLNTTVTNDHVICLPIDREDWKDSAWIISALDDRNVVRAVQLNDGTWLLAAQTVGIRESSADGQPWLTTLRYTYQWQAEEDGQTWWVRWEYRRETPTGALISPEARAHVHFNGIPETYAGGTYFPKFHLPAGRITIEDVCHFLIHEADCEPISPHCDERIAEAREIFAKIQARS